MDYRHLEKNICDTIHEGQVKLGFVNESIRIYYMIGSLNGLLGTAAKTPKEMEEMLLLFPEYAADRLGEVAITRDGSRFCFQVSHSGVSYIHRTYRENSFLEHLIRVLQNPGCTIGDIKSVFLEKSEDVVCEKKAGEEFDYVIYYKDPDVDEFYYCFSIGQMGAYYHRFTKCDYESVTS